MDAMPHHSSTRWPVRLALLAICLCAPAAMAGTIYEWTLNGQKYATDRPPPTGAKVLRVTQGHAASDTAQPSRANPSTPGAPAAPGKNADAARQVAADMAKVQSDRCTESRDRYTGYLQALRLFKPGKNNERVYLTNDELVEARVNAKREMDIACAQP